MNDSECPQPSAADEPIQSAESVRHLVARLEEEQRVRWQRGERVLVEVYLAKYPALHAQPDGIVDLLYNEFLLREKAGESPRLEDYLKRFPHLAGKLRDQFEVHGALQSEQASDAASSPMKTIASASTEPPPLADVLPAIPGYELLGELGRGGMGVVYKAHQIYLKRLVALKMILAGAHAGPQDLARFRREAEAVARVQHPNIVQIYEVGTHNGQPYFSLEFVSGGGLDRKLNGTPQPAREAARLVETLARAMHVAHQRGIIHRDLKPSNVLLSEDGTPKITDFGLAKQLDSDVRQTQSGAIVGTPSYMAPEQAGGKNKEVGPACDVYALGAILYELLTGRPPFRAETPLDTVLQVLSDEPVAPCRLLPKIPRDLETICLKCLQKDPQRRYGSAEALAEDLGRWLRSEPIQARRTGAMEQALKWGKRRPAVAGLLAALILVTLLGFGLVSWKWAEATDMRDKALRAGEVANEKAGAEAAARAESVKALQDVEKEKQQTESQLTRAETALYINRIRLAQRLLAQHDLGQADQVLESCQLSLRHWEHQYLRKLCQNRMRNFKGHNADTVVFSPDGQRLASRGDDHMIRVWNVLTAEEMLAIKTPKPKSDSRALWPKLGYSPDGKVLASSDADSIKMWDAVTGEQQVRLKHEEDVQGFAFSPNGRYLAAGISQAVVLWDLTTKQELRRLSSIADPFIMAFSEDSKRLAVADTLGSFGGVWDVQTGLQQVSIEHGALGIVLSMAFSADGNRLATSIVPISKPVKLMGVHQDSMIDPTKPGNVVVWDTTGGKEALKLDNFSIGEPAKELFKLEGLSVPISNMCFRPDGQQLATAGWDHVVRVWDAHTGRQTLALKGHTGIVNWVTFSPDGKRLASCAADQTVRLWNMQEHSEPLTLQGHADAVSSVAVSPDGKFLATASMDKTVRLWDANTCHEIAKLEGHKGVVFGVAFSPDGNLVATGGGDVTEQSSPGEVILWDFRTGQKKHSLQGSMRDRSNRFLQRLIMEDLLGLEVQPEQVLGVAFSSDGQYLASVHAAGTIRLWDVKSAREKLVLSGHEKPALSVAFCPGGKWLASAGAMDKTARIWDIATGKQHLILRGHTDAVTSVAFSREGHWLATASVDRTVKLWDVATGNEYLTLTGAADILYSVTFSPDCRRVVAGSAPSLGKPGEIKIWDTVTGQEVITLPGHKTAIYSVAFSPDGQHLYSAGGEIGKPGEVKIWTLDNSTGTIAAYQKAVDLDPKNAKAHNNLGLALEERGDLSGAIAAYRKAVELDPGLAKAHYALGNALRTKGDVPGAIAAYRTASDLDPKDAKAHYHLGDALCDHGDVPTAIAAYRKASELDPKNAKIHYSLGNALRVQGDIPGAIAAYRKASELDPKDAKAHYYLGNTLRVQGDVSGAIAAYRKASELDPKDAKIHSNLGNALRVQGDVSGAIAAYRKASELDPKNAKTHYNLGNALHAQRFLSDAIAAYRKAGELDPSDAKCHYSMGNALCDQGDLSGAIAAYRKAIKLDPSDAKAHYSMGNALRDQGDLPDAITAFHKAIELQPAYAEAHCNLGGVLRSQGKLAESLVPFRRGHELGSKQNNWRYRSGEWVQKAKRLVELERKLPGILNGQDQPADGPERIEYAEVCQYKRQYAAAVRLYQEAFAAQPALAEDVRTNHRYNAACSAALAGTGQSVDASSLNERQRAELRKQALDWLRADLAACNKLVGSSKPSDRSLVERKLRHWRRDRDLAALRDTGALAWLPPAERETWEKLWADIATELQRLHQLFLREMEEIAGPHK